MSDPLERLLKRTESWEPPPADPGGVKGRGKTLKLRRAVSSGLAGLLVVGAAGGGIFLLNRERDNSFVSDSEESDTPEMRAKVARFAFHALLEAGPYELDYQGLEKEGDVFEASFVSGPTVRDLETRVRIAEDTLDEFKNNIRKLRNRIAGFGRLDVDRSNETELQQLKDDLRLTLRFSLPAAKKDVRQFSEQLEETVAEDGPHETVVTVGVEEKAFHVEALTGPHEGQEREAISGFTEEVPERTIGYEFFNIDLIEDAGPAWDGLAIYVGPIPSSEIFRCGLELYDENDRLVARTPAGREWVSGGVDSEERRDGAGQGGPLELLTPSLLPEEELIPVTVCNPGKASPSSDGARFDPLTLDLRLKSERVRSGEEVGAFLDLRNDSGATIVDPACHLAAWRYGIVPADQPQAELWQQIVINCGQPLVMPPGYAETGYGNAFLAMGPDGEPLPPGEYLAVIEIEGRSERLVEPVTVTK